VVSPAFTIAPKVVETLGLELDRVSLTVVKEPAASTLEKGIEKTKHKNSKIAETLAKAPRYLKTV
jgi:hypothetical protein